MTLLRMRDARFTASGEPIGPLTLDVAPGERRGYVAASPREAAVVARMAAGIVKATSGILLLGEYDPRIQPAHCKRIAGFVPHDALPAADCDLERYFAYRAALWSVDPMRALAHARLLLERLEDMHEAFAFPLAGAVIASPQLVVLDRPQPAYAQQIFAAIGPRAIFSTHLSAPSADAFTTPALEATLV